MITISNQRTSKKKKTVYGEWNEPFQSLQLPKPPKYCSDYKNPEKHASKLQCRSKQLYIGEVVYLFQESFQDVINHVNAKRVQAK